MTTTTSPTARVPQIVLAGQASAPEGPVDMYMMYVLHHAFRRDLAAFADAARLTPAGARDSWQALAERWDLFAEILHHHHTGEDNGLWPLLMERTDEQGRRTLEAMEAEHAEIDPILQACAAGFARLSTHADDDARAALAVRLCAAKESLGRHLRHEETEAIAIVQAVMDEAEWQRLEAEHFRKGVSFSQVVRIVPWAAHGVPGPLRRQVFAKAGGRANELIWRLTRGRFERRERVAFRYVD
jgi:iron-sulfur cluster repair protein YtfE (RIC family)